MRDVGTLVWVVLVIIGVVGSMISSIRKQVQGQTAAQSRFRPMPAQMLPTSPQGTSPPRQAPQPLQPQVVKRAPPAPPPAFPVPRPVRRRFFAHKDQLIRGVIAAELLGKPRGLSDEPFPR
jgi:hypothetical protein